MKEVEININLQDVHAEIRKESGYIGAKAALDGSLYEQLSVQPEASDIISSYLEQGKNSLSEVFYIYLKGYSLEGDYETGDLTYTLRMTDNWLDLRKEIETGAKSYLVHYALACWLQTAEKGEVHTGYKEYMEKAVADIDQMRKMLNRRERPARPVRPEHIHPIIEKGEES